MKAEKEERYKNILKNLEESFTGLMIRKRDAHYFSRGFARY